MRATIRALCGVLALCVGCGYASNEYRWDTRYIELERELDHNRLDTARAGFAELLGETRARADRRLIQYRLAVITEREGRHRRAVSQYEALWETGEPDEVSGHAVYRAARLMYDHLDAPQDALRLWEGLLRALPEVVAADRALHAVLDHYDRAGDTLSALIVIDRLYRKLKETKLGDNLLFRRAAISRQRGELPSAILAYERLLERYPLSGLTDNTRWILAEIHRAEGHHGKALAQLKRLAEDRESSWLVGSYDSEFADDARFRRGVIYLTDLRNPRRAEEEFERFVREFPTSMLRDDARWNIVQTRLTRGDDKGARAACASLVRAEPESRWRDDCESVVRSLDEGASPSSLSGRATLE